MPTRPDVLVLAAGGILGEAWMSGLLRGLEDEAGWDLRDCEHFVGTSAGSIVAARLAAGKRPRRPTSPHEPPSDFAHDAAQLGEGSDPSTKASQLGKGSDPSTKASQLGKGSDPSTKALQLGEGSDPSTKALQFAHLAARIGAWAGTPLVPPLLALGAPVGARLRAAALARIPARTETLPRLHQEMSSLGARFDGRLRVCAVDRETGGRVVFGRPGAPHARVADAVLASCAIPWAFRPVRIDGREYVDGGAWSLTNLDAAPAGRETEVLCLHPVGSVSLALTSPLAAVRAAAGAAAEVEALALRARGARVRIVGPDAPSATRMGANLMSSSPAEAVHLAGYSQGRAFGASAA